MTETLELFALMLVAALVAIVIVDIYLYLRDIIR